MNLAFNIAVASATTKDVNMFCLCVLGVFVVKFFL